MPPSTGPRSGKMVPLPRLIAGVYSNWSATPKKFWLFDETSTGTDPARPAAGAVHRIRSAETKWASTSALPNLQMEFAVK